MEALLASPEAAVRRQVGVYLVRRGDARGIPQAIDAFKNAPTLLERQTAGNLLFEALERQRSEAFVKQRSAIGEALKNSLKTLGPDELPTARLILKDLLPPDSGKGKAEVWQLMSERFGEDATRALKPGWRDVVRSWS